MEAPVPVRGRRKGLLRLFLFVTAVAVVSSLFVVAAASVAPSPAAYMTGPMRIESVSFAPEHPQPGQPVTVTAQVGGAAAFPRSVDLQYAAYFGTVASGGGPMASVGNRLYALTVDGFPAGTEVWFVVAVSTANEGPVLSTSFTVPIGTVVRDGPSGLRISDVSHSPTQPAPWERIMIEATVASASPVTEVDVAYMSFCRTVQPVTIDPPMYTIAPNTYTIEIEQPGQCASQPGSILVYRVIARDASGNTAVSDVQVVDIL